MGGYTGLMEPPNEFQTASTNAELDIHDFMYLFMAARPPAWLLVIANIGDRENRLKATNCAFHHQGDAINE